MHSLEISRAQIEKQLPGMKELVKGKYLEDMINVNGNAGNIFFHGFRKKSNV
jgi:hypothetical protein